MFIVPHGESLRACRRIRLPARVIPLCARPAHSPLIDLLNRVSEDSCRKVFLISGTFLISSNGTGGDVLFQMVQGTVFPLSRWDCFLWRLLRSGLWGSWFLQGVSFWFLLRWWMVERVVTVLGDWLWGSWQEIKLYFCSMNQWSLQLHSCEHSAHFWSCCQLSASPCENTKVECLFLYVVLVKNCGLMLPQELLVLLLRERLVPETNVSNWVLGFLLQLLMHIFNLRGYL